MEDYREIYKFCKDSVDLYGLSKNHKCNFRSKDLLLFTKPTRSIYPSQGGPFTQGVKLSLDKN